MGKEYDLLLKGGTLIDPGSETYGQKDLAIKQGRIASVRTYISENHAYKVIDVSGLHVMPGLIDLHVHCYPPSPWTGDGFVEDAFCSQTGVTYAVDAGTTGAGNFELFRDNFIIPSTTRLKAYVHIANVGLSGPEKHGESMDLKHLDPEATAAMILANPDYTIGVKVRQAELQVGDSGLEPLRLAIRAAEIANCHVMVHIGGGTDLEEALDMLRPGDVVTHCCHGGEPNIIYEGHKVRRSVQNAYAREVIFDLGHGGGSFNFDVAERAIGEGYPPHTVSSDLHSSSYHITVKSLLEAMAKCMAVGMSLNDVVRATTINAAEVIGDGEEFGDLSNRAIADITVLEVVDGKHVFSDVSGNERMGEFNLDPRHTIQQGKVIWSHPKNSEE